MSYKTDKRNKEHYKEIQENLEEGADLPSLAEFLVSSDSGSEIGHGATMNYLFNGKEEGQCIFQYFEYQLERMGQRGYGLDERDDDAQRDGHYQGEVEDTPHGVFRLEHDAIKPFFLKPFGFLHT